MATEECNVQLDKQYINTAAVRRKLLLLSKEKRAGKFKRVSEQTLQNVNTEVRLIVERILREYKPEHYKTQLINRSVIKALLEERATDNSVPKFKVTPGMLVNIDKQLHTYLDGVVHRQPSVGKTL
jgi:predicted component of type VI protein secretion system